jgi:hypothetical protein
VELKSTLKDPSATGYYGKLGCLYIEKIYMAGMQNKNYLNLLLGKVKFNETV